MNKFVPVILLAGVCLAGSKFKNLRTMITYEFKPATRHISFNHLKKLLFLSIFLLLALLIFGCGNIEINSLDDAKYYAEKVEKYIKNGNCEKALPLLDSVRIATHPNSDFPDEELYNYVVFYEIRCFLEEQNTKRGFSIGSEWLEAYPIEYTYKNLGKLYDNFGYNQKAVDLYTEGIEKGFNVYANLASVYVELGKLDLAIENYYLAIERGENYYKECIELLLKDGNYNYNQVEQLINTALSNKKISQGAASFYCKELVEKGLVDPFTIIPKSNFDIWFTGTMIKYLEIKNNYPVYWENIAINLNRIPLIEVYSFDLPALGLYGVEKIRLGEFTRPSNGAPFPVERKVKRVDGSATCNCAGFDFPKFWTIEY